VDRQALIRLKAARENNHVPPRNEAEARMCRVWQELLQREQVGIYDNFFVLGGHSLLATRLISAVRHEFGVELPLAVLFESPRLIDLCHAVQESGDDFILPPIVPRPQPREQLLDGPKEYEF
jgi:acyl carrier protein